MEGTPGTIEDVADADTLAETDSSMGEVKTQAKNGAPTKTYGARRGTGHPNTKKPTRSVNLKRAVRSLVLTMDGVDLELYLARPDGQVCNPKVLLERLFLLSPEDQARVRIVRTALVDEEGEALRTPPSNLEEAILNTVATKLA